MEKSNANQGPIISFPAILFRLYDAIFKYFLEVNKLGL